VKTTTAAEGGGGQVVRRIRIRAMVFVILTLLTGALAVVLVRASLLKARQQREAAVQTAPVVVAALDVPIATKLEPRHLKTVAWPVESMPAGAFGSAEQVIGQSPTQAIAAGEPLLASRLSGGRRGSGLASLLGEGRRAMSVKVDQVVGIAGFIQPGDAVDVVTIMAPDDQPNGGAIVGETTRVGKVILQNIKVLAVGEHLQTSGSEAVRVTVVTLEVDPAQSERLALASQHGTVQLTMRSRLDQAEVPTSGVTPGMLLQPDEGAEPIVSSAPAPAVAVAAPGRPAGVAAVARRGTPRRPAGVEPPAAPPPPRAPTVEILRPGRVEERQLHSGSE